MAVSQTLTAYHLRVAELKIAKTCARRKIHALPMQFVLQGITEPDVNAPQASKGMLEASVKEVSFYPFWSNRQFCYSWALIMSNFFTAVPKGECEHDPDCPDNKACIENQCKDPCLEYDPCGREAICETSNHRPVCRCPEGWGGNPHDQCFQCKFSIQFQSFFKIARF